MRTLFVLSFPMLLVACRGEGGAPAATTSSPVNTAKAAPTVAFSATPTAVVTATATAAASASAAPTGSSSAEGASPVPTAAEWQSAKEVNVTGSSALACETKKVREWIGVFCNKPNDSGGTPVKVKLEKAETLHTGASVEVRKDVKLVSVEGDLSLIARYVPGTDVEATFAWSDKKRRLVLWWPADKPEPRMLGAFK